MQSTNVYHEASRDGASARVDNIKTANTDTFNMLVLEGAGPIAALQPVAQDFDDVVGRQDRPTLHHHVLSYWEPGRSDAALDGSTLAQTLFPVLVNQSADDVAGVGLQSF